MRESNRPLENRGTVRLLNLRRQDTRLLLAVAVSFALIASFLGVLVPSISGTAMLGLGVLFLTALILESYRRHEADQTATVRQVQSLMELYAVLKPRRPLPALTGWAASPELVSALTGVVLEHRPKHVLELGSGASTIVIAYALEQIGEGAVTALDHDAGYAEQTRAELQEHGLDGRASIVRAPLADQRVDDGVWRWYDLGELSDAQPIDLLVVDGPPRETQRLARYPALPALYARLSSRAVVVLDDAYRDDEKEVLRRWLARFPEFRLAYRESGKGIAVLSRDEAGEKSNG